MVSKQSAQDLWLWARFALSFIDEIFPHGGTDTQVLFTHQAAGMFAQKLAVRTGGDFPSIGNELPE
jgi:hypothetical protein